MTLNFSSQSEGTRDTTAEKSKELKELILDLRYTQSQKLEV
ncbi:hypothetical protein PC123_g19484 [Phytophthora cactorum]|nr:hypothetical protein PC123_g19484 [Phytophthora cactorum]